MLKGLSLMVAVALAIPLAASAQAQPDPRAEAARNATREKLRQLLDSAGRREDVNVIFRQSTKQPYNFADTMSDGLKNAASLEIVVSVTAKQTIGFRIFPHFNGGYINVDKVRDPAGLMRTLLRLSDRAFLFWGADESGDVFTGYTLTLESGFPPEALLVVLRSIRNSDKFVGELRPFIDGSSAP